MVGWRTGYCSTRVMGPHKIFWCRSHSLNLDLVLLRIQQLYTWNETPAITKPLTQYQGLFTAHKLNSSFTRERQWKCSQHMKWTDPQKQIHDTLKGQNLTGCSKTSDSGSFALWTLPLKYTFSDLGPDLQNILRFIIYYRKIVLQQWLATCYDFSQEYRKQIYKHYLRRCCDFARKSCLRKDLRSSIKIFHKSDRCTS